MVQEVYIGLFHSLKFHKEFPSECNAHPRFQRVLGSMFLFTVILFRLVVGHDPEAVHSLDYFSWTDSMCDTSDIADFTLAFKPQMEISFSPLQCPWNEHSTEGEWSKNVNKTKP